MKKSERATEFVLALERQVKTKSQMRDGIEADLDPWVMIASIAEELGEVASDFQRGRDHGAIAECIDVAHSALLLAITIDKNAAVLKSLHTESR